MAGEILYSARTPFPDSIVTGRDNRLLLEISVDGANVAPIAPGTFELVDSGRTVVFTAPAIAAPGNGIQVVIPQATTTNLELGQLYQGRWNPTMPGEAQPRKFRREAVVALFKLVPPVAEQDLVTGNYPDLRDQLGSFGTNLQPYLDEAWGWFLRKLFKVGRWPDLMISTQDAFDPVRERAWYLVFRFLFRRTRGPDNRFEKLMEDHRDSALNEWNSLTARWDEDHDGVADSLDRDAAQGAIHRNSAPRRRLSLFRRW